MTDKIEEIKENYLLRNEFVREKTYRLSHFLITLSVAILAAVSFLFTKDDLEPFSKLLSVAMVFPIFIVGLELRYLYCVVQINQNISEKRASDIKNGNAKSVQEIAEYVRKENKKIEFLRKLTWVFLFLTLAGIFVIILSESGVLASVGKSLRFFR